MCGLLSEHTVGNPFDAHVLKSIDVDSDVDNDVVVDRVVDIVVVGQNRLYP